MSGGERLVILIGPLRPHEMVLQALSLLIGTAYLFVAPAPTSVAASLPPWAIHIWSAGLLVSGLLSVGSVTARRRIELGLRFEAAAMLFGAASLIWAGFAIFSFTTLGRGLLAGGFCLAWSVANVIRAAQCVRDLRRIRP